MEKLEKHDIQGLIARGYGSLPYARFLLLAVEDPTRARTYLRTVRLTNAVRAPEDTALQIAFTCQGLEKLGVPVASFSREFIGGMDDAVRAKALGDQGVNDPSRWAWGHTTKPDALLLLYARTQDDFDAFERRVLDAIAGAFHVIASKSTSSSLMRDQKEHFGWRDGLSTPVVQEFGSKQPIGSWTFPFRAGEFVLGYQNEYDAYTESPAVDPADDPHDLLPPTRDGAQKDLGRNGTYLVYREMTQDVAGLWDYLETHSREPGADRVASAIALGSKMVGRWPGGAPLQTSTFDDPEQARDNEFTYYFRTNPRTRKPERDRYGLACPVGSHIRRCNPRDDLPTDRGDQNSIEMVRKHQMIRRGRPFGAPLAPSMEPADYLAMRGQPDPETRGLHFICLVGHIGRQFEFVQRAWIASPVFGAQYRDSDPLVGVHRSTDDETGNASDELTVPAEPLRRTYKRLPQFTQLIGGAYFFMPGIQAVRFIAGAP